MLTLESLSKQPSTQTVFAEGLGTKAGLASNLLHMLIRI